MNVKATLGLLVAATATLRLVLALAYPGFLGVDGGAYLQTRNAALGWPWPENFFKRPPLAPGWLLVPTTSLWGDNIGYTVWGALASVAPVVPVFLLARRWLTPKQSLLAATFLLLDPFQWEMFVTGALPQLAFAFLILALWAIAGLREGWQWREALILGASLPLIAYINQTTAALAAIAIPTFCVALYFGQSRNLLLRDYRWAPRVLTPMIIGGLMALTALPWYLNVHAGSDITRYQGPLIYMTNFPWDSNFLQFFVAAPLAIAIWRKAKAPGLRALAAVLGVHATLGLFLSVDEAIINVFYRSRYLQPLLLYPLAIWWVANHWPLGFLTRREWGRIARPGVAVLLCVWSAGAVFSFYNQSKFSTFVTPDMEGAIAYYREVDDGHAAISNTFSLAMWIGGLNQKADIHWTHAWEPPRAFTETDKDVRCVLGWVEGCDVQRAINRLDASYVILDTKWPLHGERYPQDNWMIYKAPPQPKLWEVTAGLPWLDLVFSRGTARVWRVAL